MKIDSVETIRSDEQPNVCFVRITSDTGFVGLGESFYGAQSVEAHIHDHVAPLLFTVDDASPNSVAGTLVPYVGYQGGGAETRAAGAIDMALWDLAGQHRGAPLFELLGGLVRDRARTYNTCAGPKYVSSTMRQNSSNWGIPSTRVHRYDDLHGFLNSPRELAKDLMSDGITAMKIWPFDRAAEASRGVDISQDDLDAGIRVIADIRDELGASMDILVELHGLWMPRGAVRIAEALEPYQPYWIEDPIRPDAIEGLRSLRGHTGIPIATGETTVGRRGFLPLLTDGIVDVATVDVGWTGGLSEAVRIATLADTYGVALAPHDCTGPVSLAIATHLTCSQSNGLVQESARAFINTWYRDMAEGFPEAAEGHLAPTATPGHGVRLVEGLGQRPGVSARLSTR